MEAEISLSYDDKRTAEAIAQAVSPENFRTPKGLSIETTWIHGTVLTRIDYSGKLQTFIATIDDLLFSVSTAEKTLQTTIKLMNCRTER